MTPTPEIIGHRGAPREERENTLPAFERALALGADGIELDVHGSADGVPVVHHDAVTNARPGDNGPRLAIARASLDELRATANGGAGLPTLAEVLAHVGWRAVVYVEIKASGIEREVVEAIRNTPVRAAVHGFDHRIVLRAGELSPGTPLGILQTSYPVDPIRAMRDAHARDLWQHWELVDRALVDMVHADGGRLVAWTVNDVDTAARFIEWGVDGICTDVPGEMRGLVPRPRDS